MKSWNKNSHCDFYFTVLLSIQTSLWAYLIPHRREAKPMKAKDQLTSWCQIASDNPQGHAVPDTCSWMQGFFMKQHIRWSSWNPVNNNLSPTTSFLARTYLPTATVLTYTLLGRLMPIFSKSNCDWLDLTLLSSILNVLTHLTCKTTLWNV